MSYLRKYKFGFISKKRFEEPGGFVLGFACCFRVSCVGAFCCQPFYARRATMFDSFSSDQGFQHYLANTERYPVLTRERELSLSTKFHEGNKFSGDFLVCCNLRYVVKIAIGYRGYGFKLG